MKGLVLTTYAWIGVGNRFGSPVCFVDHFLGSRVAHSLFRVAEPAWITAEEILKHSLQKLDDPQETLKDRLFGIMGT